MSIESELITDVELPQSPLEDLFQRFSYLNDVHYRLVTSVEEVREYLRGLGSGDPISLDLETSGLFCLSDSIVGISLSRAEKEGIYVPVAHTVKKHLNVNWEALRSVLEEFLYDHQRPCVVYNQKFEGNFLEAAGMDVAKIDWQDCMVSVYIHDSNFGGKKLGLKARTKDLLGFTQIEFDDMFPDVPKDQRNFAAVDPYKAYLYACGDTDFSLRLWNYTAKDREEQPFIYHKVENPLTDVLRRMENNGVFLDVAFYQRLYDEMAKRIEVVKERIYRVTGRIFFKKRTRTLAKRDAEGKTIKGADGKSIKEQVVDYVESPFDLSSPQQVGKKLFSPVEEGGLGIENNQRTETGKVATGKEIIADLAAKDPVCADVLLYRKLEKCQSTYLKHLIEDVNENNDGFFGFNQCAAPSGRLSASADSPGSGKMGMNAQSIPKAEPAEDDGWVIEEWVDPPGWGGDSEVNPPEDYPVPCLNAEPIDYLMEEPKWVCFRKECECIKQGRAKGACKEKIKHWSTPNIREGVIPHPGYLIVSIDYAGIELRVAANISKEPVWVNAFHQPDPDLHMETAKAIFGKEASDISKGERSQAKTCVAKGTLILMQDGSYRAVEDLVGYDSLGEKRSPSRELQIRSYDGFRDVDTVFYGGEKDCLSLTTRQGHHIKQTPDHPIPVLRGGDIELLETQKLEVGDYILCLDYPESVSPDSVDGITVQCLDFLLSNSIHLAEVDKIEEAGRLPVFDLYEPYHKVMCANAIFTGDCNFAVLYGGSGRTLAEQIPGLGKEGGDKLISKFFSSLPTLKSWIDRQHRMGRRTHMVKTWFERKRPLHMYKDDDPKTMYRSRSFGDRSTVSTAIQGTAADVMKIALLRLDRIIRKNGWQNYVRMLLTVHDEVVFEVRKDKLNVVVPGLVEAMAFPVKGWPVPLVCDIEIGENWGEGKEHRLVEGKLVLHDDIKKALAAGKTMEDIAKGAKGYDLSPATPVENDLEANTKKAVVKEDVEPEVTLVKPALQVTIKVSSMKTKSNLEKLRDSFKESQGGTEVIVSFHGDENKYLIKEKVDIASLLKVTSEKGLSISVIS